MFARSGVPQERFLSAMVPFTFLGVESLAVVEREAGEHVDRALDGQVMHRVYSR